MTGYENDPRYRQRGWTLITDNSGSRFVPWPGWYWKDGTLVEGKKRRKPRAVRFAEVKEGDVLVHRSKSVAIRRPRVGEVVAANEVEDVSWFACFCVVRFRWFDPVAGQDDPLAGEMVGVCQVRSTGQLQTAYPHTLRGLALQGYHYATTEQAERVRAFIVERRALLAALDSGETTLDEARLRALPYSELVRDL